MLDCSEGAQKQLRRMRLPMMKIDHIFISHLHGDHYLGLAGLLFSYHLLGRTKALNIYAPEGLQEIIELQFKVSDHQPAYPLYFHVIREGGQQIYEDKSITVETIAMMHRIPTYGYLFREKQALRNIRKDAIEHYNIPIDQISKIKSGEDLVRENGEIVPNHKLTKDPSAPRTYAFCSDTGYTGQYLNQIKNVDLLYHEATFLHDKVEIARQKTHCTSIDAATIAKEAGVGQLLIGHYSARYDDMKLFEKEAKTVFSNTILAQEGLCVEIGENKNRE